MHPLRIVWNYTKAIQGMKCITGLHLMEFEGVKPVTTGRMAMGDVLHTLRKDFYRFGKDGSWGPEFESPESFGGHGRGKWLFTVNRGRLKYAVEWRDDDEKYQLEWEVERICRTVYGRYAKEGPPLGWEIDLPVFTYDGRLFDGKLDDIRPGPVIREVKTWLYEPDDSVLKKDPQLTIYALGIGYFCHRSPAFAESIGVPREVAERLGGNPDYFSDSIGLEYHHMRTDRTFPVRRDDSHYHELSGKLAGFEERLASGDILPEEGEKCKGCGFRGECKRRISGEIPFRITIQSELLGEPPEEFDEGPERVPVIDRPGQTERSTQKSFRFPKNE
jgi:hypothetical protein